MGKKRGKHIELVPLSVRAERKVKSRIARHTHNARGNFFGTPGQCAAVNAVFSEYLCKTAFRKTVLYGHHGAVISQKRAQKLSRCLIFALFDRKNDDVVLSLHLRRKLCAHFGATCKSPLDQCTGSIHRRNMFRIVRNEVKRHFIK